MITTHVFRTILRDALRPFNERFTRASELEHRRGSCPPQTDPRGTDSILLLACAAVHREWLIHILIVHSVRSGEPSSWPCLGAPASAWAMHASGYQGASSVYFRSRPYNCVRVIPNRRAAFALFPSDSDRTSSMVRRSMSDKRGSRRGVTTLET